MPVLTMQSCLIRMDSLQVRLCVCVRCILSPMCGKETNSSNIFIVTSSGELLTPFADACLPGITRGIVLDTVAPASGVRAREARISLVDVYTAAEMFACGTLGELVPVVLVDGRVIGSGARGPVTAKLQTEVCVCVCVCVSRAYACVVVQETHSRQRHAAAVILKTVNAFSLFNGVL
jgi:hypothetical protein